jgi:putative transposase
MANTYTQIFVHIVFAVQNRECIIKEQLRTELEKYITGIVNNNKSKLIAIYCNPDHLHVLVSLHPTVAVATITGDIKSGSSKWINKNHKMMGRFNWQDGYGGFSCSKSQIDDISSYILNQASHHKRKTFKEEYMEILTKSEIDYDDAYLFNWID